MNKKYFVITAMLFSQVHGQDQLVMALDLAATLNKRAVEFNKKSTLIQDDEISNRQKLEELMQSNFREMQLLEEKSRLEQHEALSREQQIIDEELQARELLQERIKETLEKLETTEESTRQNKINAENIKERQRLFETLHNAKKAETKEEEQAAFERIINLEKQERNNRKLVEKEELNRAEKELEHLLSTKQINAQFKKELDKILKEQEKVRKKIEELAAINDSSFKNRDEIIAEEISQWNILNDNFLQKTNDIKISEAKKQEIERIQREKQQLLNDIVNKETKTRSGIQNDEQDLFGKLQEQEQQERAKAQQQQVELEKKLKQKKKNIETELLVLNDLINASSEMPKETNKSTMAKLIEKLPKKIEKQLISSSNNSRFSNEEIQQKKEILYNSCLKQISTIYKSLLYQNKQTNLTIKQEWKLNSQSQEFARSTLEKIAQIWPMICTSFNIDEESQISLEFPTKRLTCEQWKTLTLQGIYYDVIKPFNS